MSNERYPSNSSRGSHLTKRGRRAAVATGVAIAGAAAAIFTGASSSAEAPAQQNRPDYTYLQNDQQERVQVADGMTPEWLVKAIYKESRRNGRGPAELNGQALIDAENYVAEQGDIIEQNSSGATVHFLKTGQNVMVPVVTPEQAAKSLADMESNN